MIGACADGEGIPGVDTTKFQQLNFNNSTSTTQLQQLNFKASYSQRIQNHSFLKTMNQKPTLHFFCGKMASGKSTLARSLAEEKNTIPIAEDVWLSKLYPEEINTFDDYLKYSPRLKAILSQHIQHLLLQDISVVLDFPGNTPSQRNWFRPIFESVGANHLLHYVVASNELCKQQLKIRRQDKPEGSAFTTEAEFEAITKYFQPPTPEEGFNIHTYQRKYSN